MALNPGNLLGAPRAEADTVMLEKAFVETKDFLALVETDDFNFIVGRRGTGKSALFSKLWERLSRRGDLILIQIPAEEHEAAALNGMLTRYSRDYVTLRRITKLLWRAELLFSVLRHKNAHYKRAKLTCDFLESYEHELEKDLGPLQEINRSSILRRYVNQAIDASQLPARIASEYQLDRLEANLAGALSQNGIRATIMCDRLDEGWLPDSVATAALGGLASAVSSFKDRRSPVHTLLFVRDNMFRALSHMDSDFSRNIEGCTLRLTWDKTALFHLVAQRLRVALNAPGTENDTKIWNRFAQRELRDREGFEVCLRSTLYRPRDILVLLNAAYRFAGHDERDSIVPEDLDQSANQISNDRLNDLLKEYDEVLPGLRLLTDSFKSRPARAPYSEVLDVLRGSLDACTFSDRATSDFALLNTPAAMFEALYGVGFLGIMDKSSGSYQFCHDGAPATSELDPTRQTVVHPCYWKALGSTEASLPEHIVVEVNDEFEPNKTDTADFRTKRLGTVLSDLAALPIGAEGQSDFENWVFRAIRLLFPGSLSNIQLKPNGDAIQRRDVVATNTATGGFWKRILDDYKSRQVVFEMKNFESMGPDEFRQVANYLTGEYGKFAILVTRSRDEGLTDVERGWVKEQYFSHERLVMLLPAPMIARAVHKIRSPKRFDYADDMLGKRMDIFVRSYLSHRHQNHRK